MPRRIESLTELSDLLRRWFIEAIAVLVIHALILAVTVGLLRLSEFLLESRLTANSYGSDIIDQINVAAAVVAAVNALARMLIMFWEDMTGMD